MQVGMTQSYNLETKLANVEHRTQVCILGIKVFENWLKYFWYSLFFYKMNTDNDA